MKRTKIASLLCLAQMATLLALGMYDFSTWAVERPAGRLCQLILSPEPISPVEATRMALEALDEHAPEVQFDSFGMVVPSKTSQTKAKIVSGIEELKARVTSAANDGKHVLYLSGSFDLIHRGHAAFVSFSIDAYLKRHGLVREQLFVIVAADGDELLGVGKASKYVGNGGKESFRRPVQRAELFNTDVHPRALDLATLPVDTVVMTPSPQEVMGSLLVSDDFKISLREVLKDLDGRVESLLSQSQNNPTELKEALAQVKNLEPFIRAMSRLILSGQSQHVVDEFIQSANIEKAKASPIWNITAWHFLLHSYMTDDVESLESFARVLNAADADYLMVVATMQNLTGINILVMPEEKNMSTTDLLKAHGAEVLIEAKRVTHEN